MFKIYPRNIDGHYHFKTRLEARGKKIKTIFPSWINFYSPGQDVVPSNTLVHWRGYGNWSQVPTHLERNVGGNGEEDCFRKNGGVRQIITHRDRT